MTHRVPEAGSVSTGTLNTRDLIVVFADAVQLYGDDVAENRDLVSEARDQAQALAVSPVDIDAITKANDLLNDLFDALDTIAGKHGMHFGAHEGDGADFGFWHNSQE